MASLQATTLPSISISGDCLPTSINWQSSSNWTYANSWVDYTDASYAPPRYCKFKDWVYIEGLVKGGTTTASNTIATLPTGYRMTSAGSGNTTGTIFTNWHSSGMFEMRVYTSGALQINGTLGSNTWLSVYCSYYAGP